MQDTSKWPSFIARLLEREQVTDQQVRMLIGENLLRVWEEVEKVASDARKQGELPCEEPWEGRVWEPVYTDLPRVFPNT